MTHLRLLGTARMSGPDPEPSRTPRGARLALLALLAADGRRGMSRERLMSILWPEVPEERARPLLRDTLYRLRESIGASTISTAGDLLALDPDRVDCDTWRFEAAVAMGAWEEADRLYAGALLEGSFPIDSLEFEHWLDAERARLARLHLKCLEAIAASRESEAAWNDAAAAWRRLCALDAYNARYAIGLMRALAATGDRAGALQHAATHTAALANDLGAAPDPDVAALAERLRVSPPILANIRGPESLGTAARPRVAPAPMNASRATWTRRAFAAGVVIMAAAVMWWWRIGPGTTARDAVDVGVKTVPVVSSGTGNAVAHDHYLRGRYHLARRGTSNILTALSEFEDAIRHDPRFSQAHAGLSAAVTLLTLYNGKAYPRDSMLPIALAAARRAVALNDSLSEAHAALGQVLTYRGNRTDGERAYRRAILLDPDNATIHQWYAELLITLGRVDEAIQQMEAAVRLDPQSAINHAVAANHYRLGGRYDDALRMAERAVTLDPTMPAVWEFYARVLFDAGHRDSAEHVYSRHAPRHVLHAYMRARNGDLALRDSLRRVAEDWSSGAWPVDGTVALAVLSLAAGNKEAALRVLERAQESDPAFPLHSALIDPMYDPIRGMPAFREIIRKAGLDETLILNPRRTRSVVSAAP